MIIYIAHCQYTCSAWIDRLKQHNIIISMDGKGRWADNIWIERIWRTIKYECVNLFGVENLLELKSILGDYISYYNNKRLHSSLGYAQPAKHYEISIQKNNNADFIVYCEIDKNKAITKKVA